MKILTVFTGGTIGSDRNGGVISPDAANSRFLIELYRSICGGADVELVQAQPYCILSENLTGTRLNALYKCIAEYDLNEFDGVIVAHGTDTLQYTCAFLSYKLGLCETPVAVISANYPLEEPRSNGLANFAAAVDFIRQKGHRGVFAVYRNPDDDFAGVHRASRLLPHLPYSDKIFSADGKLYGTVADGVFEKSQDYSEQDDLLSESDFGRLSEVSDVLYLKAHPSMIFPTPNENPKAILLEGYHSGTLATDYEGLKRFCAQAGQNKTPVFLTGDRAGFGYESKALYKNLGITVLPPISPTAAYMKLWLLKDVQKAELSRGGDIFC